MEPSPSPQGQPVALYDIGSNSVKVLVAHPSASDMDILLEEVEYPRLGEGVEGNGTLSPDAVERTLDTLARLKERAQAAGAKKHRAVATSAVRSAANGEAFKDLVLARTGLTVEILSGKSEALGVFRGVCTDPSLQGHSLWVMDLGGGSVEWITGKSGAVEWHHSLPIGCVRMKERFLERFPFSSQNLRALESFVAEATGALLAPHPPTGRTAVCTGGTMCAMARWLCPRFIAISRSGRGFCLTLPQFEEASHRLAAMTPDQIQALPGPIAQRADIIVAGAFTFLAIFKALGLTEWRISHRNLRYGLVCGA
jgi:exopolyphosphatase/guanosine-5'-triphosphate,3'-diphosphate pyrophosphatase